MKQFKHKNGQSLTSFFLRLTKWLVILTTINYIMKKPQLTKDQRYDRLKWKRTFQTSRKEKIPWVEVSGRLTTPAI